MAWLRGRERSRGRSRRGPRRTPGASETASGSAIGSSASRPGLSRKAPLLMASEPATGLNVTRTGPSRKDGPRFGSKLREGHPSHARTRQSRPETGRRAIAAVHDDASRTERHRLPRRCGLGCVPVRCRLQLAGWIRTCSWCHATSPLSISSTRRSLLRALAMTARQVLFVRRCISAAWLRARSASWRSPV